MKLLIEVQRIASTYGVTVVPCWAPFAARWIVTYEGELIVSSNLTSEDIDEIETYLESKRPAPALRLIGASS